MKIFLTSQYKFLYTSFPPFFHYFFYSIFMFLWFLTEKTGRKFVILPFHPTCCPSWYLITSSEETYSAWIWKEIWLKFKTIPCAVMRERHFIVLSSVASGYGKRLNAVMCLSDQPCQLLIGLIQWQSFRVTSIVLITVKQQEERVYGQFIVIEKKVVEGEMERERNH